MIDKWEFSDSSGDDATVGASAESEVVMPLDATVSDEMLFCVRVGTSFINMIQCVWSEIHPFHTMSACRCATFACFEYQIGSG